jgi:uncharacterized protein (TIGR02996 family)
VSHDIHPDWVIEGRPVRAADALLHLSEHGVSDAVRATALGALRDPHSGALHVLADALEDHGDPLWDGYDWRSMSEKLKLDQAVYAHLRREHLRDGADDEFEPVAQRLGYATSEYFGENRHGDRGSLNDRGHDLAGSVGTDEEGLIGSLFRVGRHGYRTQLLDDHDSGALARQYHPDEARRRIEADRKETLHPTRSPHPSIRESSPQLASRYKMSRVASALRSTPVASGGSLYPEQYSRGLRRKYSMDDDAFLRAIHADLTTPSPRMVYADWLDENHRPDDAARERLKAKVPVYDFERHDLKNFDERYGKPVYMTVRNNYRGNPEWGDLDEGPHTEITTWRDYHEGRGQTHKTTVPLRRRRGGASLRNDDAVRDEIEKHLNAIVEKDGHRL